MINSNYPVHIVHIVIHAQKIFYIYATRTSRFFHSKGKKPDRGNAITYANKLRLRVDDELT